MQREVFTKIKVRSDYPVSYASSINGANIDSVAFNMAYIANLDPKLAANIIKLSERANNLRPRSKRYDSN